MNLENRQLASIGRLEEVRRSSFVVKMGILVLALSWMAIVVSSQARVEENGARVIDLKGGPDSVFWIVQLSDLHFSVHHPQRATDFKKLVGPALSLINPSLVLITGDLTDGKSRDLLTMKQNEEEWFQYKDVMEDVVKASKLDERLFFDLRGNHDSFGVPAIGGSFDYFSKHSMSGKMGRTGNVNSITIQAGGRKHLFVGFDSTTSVGLRGPTNLFGHPTDSLLKELDSELSLWDSTSTEPITKIAFGHFPLSFSASSLSGKSLKDIFLKHSLSAYLCGHLHTRFGKNLKRHHQSSESFLYSQNFFQFNVHQTPSQTLTNCLHGGHHIKEFWEWEMGDWRKSRAMRILAIDEGFVSYLDIDFKSEPKKIIVLPTFPLDSRFMSTSSSYFNYKCQLNIPSSNERVRALVFSLSPIVSVTAKIYDSNPGSLSIIMQAVMTKHVDNSSRGDLYSTPWNYKAFEDPSPYRYWLQIEATDSMGSSTSTELRPFSINGVRGNLSWTWKEFIVMGCQWDALYYPIFWTSLCSLFSILLIPKLLFFIFKKQYTYIEFLASKGFLNGTAWFFSELGRVRILWFGIIGYLVYLITCPWFIGKISTDGRDIGYMTYIGWAIKTSNGSSGLEYIGSPDIMVVVLPHLFFVVFPTVLASAAFVAEREMYRVHFRARSGKKTDDYDGENRSTEFCDFRGMEKLRQFLGQRWIRRFLLMICVGICWKHFSSCRALMKGFEMNPVVDFPVYSLWSPLLLGYAAYKTSSIH